MSDNLSVNLTAAIVAADQRDARVLTTKESGESALGLPSGLFEPLRHRTLEVGLRQWVTRQTALAMGYVEQLYTFGDRGRRSDVHELSIGYLALTRHAPDQELLTTSRAAFRGWYDFFPWEDARNGRPAVLDEAILPRLRAWAGGDAARLARLRMCFGLSGMAWDEDKVLERYELLYEAGLVAEAARDGIGNAQPEASCGVPMRVDHRRILATAISRLRGKIKYRPVVFELMPPVFTLTALQNTVEAIAGKPVHKQNFRRLVEQGALVEPTGQTVQDTGGRPAQAFSFRRDVIAERPAAGLKV
jgi:hypothetical protein